MTDVNPGQVPCVLLAVWRGVQAGAPAAFQDGHLCAEGGPASQQDLRSRQPHCQDLPQRLPDHSRHRNH